MDDKLKREVMQTIFRLRKLHGADRWGSERQGRSRNRSRHSHGFNINAVVILNIIETESAKQEHSDFSTIIQEQLHITKPAVSMQLKTLERKGLIERTVNTNDLRRFDFRLTAKGELMTRHLREVMDKRIERVIEQMGEQDMRELLRLFNQFVDAMDQTMASSDAASASFSCPPYSNEELAHA